MSYLLTIVSKRIIHWGMPLGVSIEPTNYCNLACKECPVGLNLLKREKANISTDLYKKILDELSPFLSNIIIYFQGEPFINSHIYEMISYASDKHVYSIISTNGHYFTEENVKKILKSGLNKLIISVDGTTQEVYEKYRVGGKLSTVINGTKLIVKAKKNLKVKRPMIVLQFLVTAENEHQIKDAKQLAKTLNVDSISFKSAQIYDFENGNKLIPKNDKFSRYKKLENGKYAIKSKLRNRCWRMWAHPVVTASGDVLPCCFDKDAKYCMGNIKSQSFSEIWKSEKYINFRKQVFSNRKEIDMCKNCTEGLFKL